MPCITYIIPVILIQNLLVFSAMPLPSANGLENAQYVARNPEIESSFEPTKTKHFDSPNKGVYELEDVLTWMNDMSFPADSKDTNSDVSTTGEIASIEDTDELTDTEGNRRDDAGATDVSNRSPLVRVRRAFITDNGYGSRLQAGSNLARSVSAMRDVFGAFGPGKRKRGYAEVPFTYVYGPTIDNTGHGLDLSKRFMTDNGYGSRIQAGTSLADDLMTRDNLFGIGGPGKRSGYAAQSYNVARYNPDFRLRRAEPVVGTFKRPYLRYVPRSPVTTVLAVRGVPKRYGVEPMLSYPVVDSASYGGVDVVHRPVVGVVSRAGVGVAKRYMPITDGGFGSRIQTATDIARSNGIQVTVFGAFGPGRRKRDVEYMDSIGKSDKYMATGDVAEHGTA